MTQVQNFCYLITGRIWGEMLRDGLQHRCVNGLLHLSLLPHDFGAFPFDVVTSFGLLLTDRWCCLLPELFQSLNTWSLPGIMISTPYTTTWYHMIEVLRSEQVPFAEQGCGQMLQKKQISEAWGWNILSKICVPKVKNGRPCSRFVKKPNRLSFDLLVYSYNMSNSYTVRRGCGRRQYMCDVSISLKLHRNRERERVRKTATHIFL